MYPERRPRIKLFPVTTLVSLIHCVQSGPLNIHANENMPFHWFYKRQGT